jgi:hypothetical protein
MFLNGCAGRASAGFADLPPPAQSIFVFARAKDDHDRWSLLPLLAHLLDGGLGVDAYLERIFLCHCTETSSDGVERNHDLANDAETKSVWRVRWQEFWWFHVVLESNTVEA